MNWKPLDKIDADLYKGIAILMIVLHNFMHLLPIPQQNEFAFYPDSFFDFIHLILSEPQNTIQGTLSFFGHYGVQIFVFLSAYGLAKKYSIYRLKYWPFIWQRIIKIYPAFILAVLAWLILRGWVMDWHGILGPIRILFWNFDDLILKFLLLPNFLWGNPLSPVGPWWFIPFIFQFYLIFPFLLSLYSRWGGPILLVLSVLSIVLSIISVGRIAGFNIYFTVLGHLPEFCLGIYLARKDDVVIRVPSLIILAAFVIYFIGNMYEIFWHVSHLSFLVLLLAAFTYVVPKIKNNRTFKEMFLFFAAISLPLFLVNGFLRNPYISWATDYNHWLLTIALCLLSLMTSVLVALALSKIEKQLMSKANTETPISLFRQISKALISTITRTK